MFQKFLIFIKHNLPIFLFYFYCSSFCGPPCNKYCNVLTTYCVSGVSIHPSLAAVSVANVSKTHYYSLEPQNQPETTYLRIQAVRWLHAGERQSAGTMFTPYSSSAGSAQIPTLLRLFHPLALSAWFSVYPERTMLLSLSWWISVQCQVGVEECLPACTCRANCPSTVLVWKLSSSCWIIMIAFHKPCARWGLALGSASQVPWHGTYWRYLTVDPDGRWL